MRKLLALVLVAFLLSCGSGNVERRGMLRLGIPSDALPLFGSAGEPLSGELMIVTLKPDERVRNLEVLLFSTRSAAFDSIVVPARTAPILKKWASPFPRDWGENIREDILSPFVEEGEGIYALPLTLDFPVFVRRKDVLAESPVNLGDLRESLGRTGRSQRNGGRLLSSLPEELLFLSLLASERGLPPDRFYSPHSIRLLEFFREFDLRRITLPEIESEFQNGEAAAAFIRLSEAAGLIRRLERQGVRVEADPLPSTLKSFSVFDGFCLMGYGFESRNIAPLRYFTGDEFQSGLAAAGIPPAWKRDFDIPAVNRAAAGTTVVVSPFGWEESSFLKEAIADTVALGEDPETSLIRAEARLRNSAVR